MFKNISHKDNNKTRCEEAKDAIYLFSIWNFCSVGLTLMSFWSSFSAQKAEYFLIYRRCCQTVSCYLSWGGTYVEKVGIWSWNFRRWNCLSYLKQNKEYFMVHSWGALTSHKFAFLTPPTQWSEIEETLQCTYVCNDNTFSSFLET